MPGRIQVRWLVVTALIVAGALWLIPRRHPPGPRLVGIGRPLPSANGTTAPAPTPIPVASTVSPDEDRVSHLADVLNSPKTDIHADLRLLNAIFIQYRGATHELNPVGENVEITRVLTGRNRLGFAFIAPDNPAINAKGELCDRWGTPFFFHSLSGTEMEIRSAGPDRKLWTADDQVLTPGLHPPQL